MDEDQFGHLPADARAVVTECSEAIKKITARYSRDYALGSRPRTPTEMCAADRAHRDEIAPLQKIIMDILSHYPSRPMPVVPYNLTP